MPWSWLARLILRLCPMAAHNEPAIMVPSGLRSAAECASHANLSIVGRNATNADTASSFTERLWHFSNNQECNSSVKPATIYKIGIVSVLLIAALLQINANLAESAKQADAGTDRVSAVAQSKGDSVVPQPLPISSTRMKSGTMGLSRQAMPEIKGFDWG